MYFQILAAAHRFATSKGHYAGSIAVLTWVTGHRILTMLGFRTVPLDAEFFLYFIISYWIIGVLLHMIFE